MKISSPRLRAVSILPAVLFVSVALLAGAASAANAYRFVVLADSRGDEQSRLNDEALSSVFTAVAGLDPAPEFVFFVGDLAYGYDTPARLTADFDVWKSVIRDSGYPPERVYPVFGGHERTAPAQSAREAWTGFEDYFDPVAQSEQSNGEPEMSCHYFDPAYSPPGSQTGYSHTVYYCDYGGDRFFALNNDCIPPSHSVAGGQADDLGCTGHELGCAQFNWLRYHLRANGKRHNFFFHHEPAFGTGAHERSCPNPPHFVMDNKQPARNDYARLLGFNNATAAFSGHEHQYTWRWIDHHLVDRSLNNPQQTATSLAILIKASPLGQAAGPAVAYSYEGAVQSGQPRRAARLKLWWRSKKGKPDWSGYIDSGPDDAEELARAGGEPYLTSSDLELMRDEDQAEQRYVALRWTDVPIPPDARVLKAKIQFTAKRNSGKGPRVRIRGEAAPFAFPFSRCLQDVTLRPETRASKTWRIKAWKQGKRYQTPNLAKIFRELIKTHGYGQRFPLGFPEIKAGSSGAPWNQNSCSAYMGNVLAQLISLADYDGQGTPYHYAVVDVDGDQVDYGVYSWDGTLLPAP